MLKGHRAVRKIAGHLADNYRLAIPLDGIDRLNCVVVFLLGLDMPLLDGGQPFDGSPFIFYNSMIDEALPELTKVPVPALSR